MRVHLRGRGPRVAGNILLAIGLICLGISAYVYLNRALFQAWESWRFDHRQRTEASLSESQPASRPHQPAEVSGAPEAQNPSGPQTGRPGWAPPVSKAAPKMDSVPSTIGRISIPRLHLTAMVGEGIDDWTLNRAVGHIPSTALPGQAGNVGVAGHRDTFFRALKDLNVNDKIYFSTLDGDYEYQVESLKIVEPSNVGVLAQDSEHILTIVTCYPFYYIGNAPKRFIARARQIGEQAAR
jgi:sortase A